MGNYQIEFSKVKRLVIIRDGFKCQLAKSRGIFGPYGHWGILTVDHIHRRSTSGTNELKNLITLCSGHHDFVETMPQEKKSQLLYGILEKRYHYSY